MIRVVEVEFQLQVLWTSTTTNITLPLPSNHNTISNNNPQAMLSNSIDNSHILPWAALKIRNNKILKIHNYKILKIRNRAVDK